MDVFVAPFEVVNYSLVRQLLFHYKNVLEEVNNSLFNIKMIELSNHSFLIL
tara:strand:- start:602 stop:754 length:153 start_codon:yes stop_codon:yes gene_type:complete